MSSAAFVTVHCSQFPERVRAQLLDSLRSRRVNPKFHYESYKQTRKWLRLHEAFSPSRTDPDCEAIYDEAFEAVLQVLPPGPIHLVGLGCGGGQKDLRLLRRLRQAGREAAYTALGEAPEERCHALVCDLGAADAASLNQVLARGERAPAHRLLTFFGMIPNFEPSQILPRLAGLTRPEDTLLFSANLAPGADYAAGTLQVLPQYDNDLTRDWLMVFLTDLGVESADGRLQFGIEEDPASGLRRITARFEFARPREVWVEDEAVRFEAGANVRLFFSYRYTPDRLGEHLARKGLKIRQQWVTRTGQEGVFLVRRAT
jgi:uncharacterized SAM-dependent methyltransferase